MRTIGRALCTIAIALLSTIASSAESPHYVFVLPDGYVGWIQIIFSAAGAPRLPFHHGRFVLRINKSGILKTSSVGVFSGSHDQFFYSTQRKGKEVLSPVPSNYYCDESSGIDSCYGGDGTMSDGFTVGRATLGHFDDGSLGNSWFLFIGPPDLRAKMAKPIHRAPGEKYQLDVPEDDPKPGMITANP